MASYGKFSSYQVEKWLNELQGCYAALHYDDPDIAGAYMSEVTGGSYIRQKITFTLADARAIWNAADLKWAGLPAYRITHFAVWDVSINGNYICSAPLKTVARLTAGSSYSIAAYTVAMSFAGSPAVVGTAS
jgi:hypothetical protein